MSNVKRNAAMACLMSTIFLASCGGESGGGTQINVASNTVSLTANVGIASSLSASKASNSTSSSSASISSATAQTPLAPSNSIYVPSGYQLKWYDEFSVDGAPDTKKWGFDTYANLYDLANGEKQYYAANRLENARVSAGNLMITAIKEDLTGRPNYQGQHYSSARLWSYYTGSWTYGYFEIRARLPCGGGTWPAIWTLGKNGNWPGAGEIDIMEQLGKAPTTVFGSVHNKAYPAGQFNSRTVSNPCNNFHVYQMTWTSERIDIGVDGTPYSTYVNNHTNHDQWPFDEPQFLLLNLAIGGLGGPIDEGAYPRSMLVDYVRVYQKTK